MRGLLARGAESRFGTFGRLYFPGWSCYSLELPDRDNRPNISRIPPGEYQLTYVKTGRPFSGREYSYWVHDVEGRTGILAHSGTWAGNRDLGLLTHSLGCILLGYSVAWVGGQPGLLRSRPCVWDLMDNVLRGEPAELRVT